MQLQAMQLKPFFVWQNKVLKKVDPMKVMLLYTEQNLTHIFLSDQSYFLVRSSLTKALKKLPADLFIKIDRSVAASIFYIDDIARDHLVVEGKPFSIGRSYYKSVIARLNIIE